MLKKLFGVLAVVATCSFVLTSFAGCAPCEHDYSETSRTDSTCIAQGKVVYTCSKCDGTKEELLPLGEHDYAVTPITPSTFWEDGEGVYDCKLCDDNYQGVIKKGLATSGIPSLHFTFANQTDFEKMSTTSAVSDSDKSEPTVSMVYRANGHDSEDFEGYATLKFQGQTSRTYAKKNYNVKFFKDVDLDKKNKVVLNDAWGKQNKYCLKANWTDFSQSRNLLASRLWGQMVSTRANVNPLLAQAANKGAMDGFPVIVYLNDNYWGMYTLNTAKDEWAFNMDDSPSEGIMYMSKSVDWKSYVDENKTEPWEIEYNATEDDGNEWMVTSFNSLIDLVNNKASLTDAQWKTQIATKLDVNAVVDWMIFSTSINAWDNYCHNTLFATYDGKVWIPCMYDLDQTFGKQNNTSSTLFSPTQYIPYFDGDTIKINAHNHNSSIEKNNDPLWNKFYKLFRAELYARYIELRATTLTANNFSQMFSAWVQAIPQAIRDADYAKWPNQFYASNYNKIETFVGKYVTYMSQRLTALDGFYNQLGDTLMA